MLCVAFGKTGELVYTGAQNGNVYCFNKCVLERVVKAHEGPAFALYCLDKVLTLVIVS